MTPASSSALNRVFVAAAVPKPAYCPMIHGFASAEMPRVYGNSPGCSVTADRKSVV